MSRQRQKQLATVWPKHQRYNPLSYASIPQILKLLETGGNGEFLEVGGKLLLSPVMAKRP
jgi:hypothetical protein